MHALIFLWQPTGTPIQPVSAYQLVIAADSGLDTAERWGIVPDLAVGDFDSVDPQAMARAEQMGVPMQRVPQDKDETDAELAIGIALERGATSITIIGSSQGRADHAFALLNGLGVARFAQCEVRAVLDDNFVSAVRTSITLDCERGRLVSLIPLYGDVTGVTTDGLRFALSDATLHVGSSFSACNEFVGNAQRASVSISTGVLLTMQSPLS